MLPEKRGTAVLRMNILYLDTSQNVLITGVLRGAENFPRSCDAGKNGHTRLLMSEIDSALRAAGLTFRIWMSWRR